MLLMFNYSKNQVIFQGRIDKFSSQGLQKFIRIVFKPVN
ncbi:MAG: hypothetical protein N4J56_006771 [Chroococcidiopsis sp. SAG 2025]|nr:hypothetical protein [Chroococcidiopsis sp. SAG 2025]